MALQHLLYLRCGNIFSRSPDDVFASVDKMKYAVRGLPNQIARVEPATTPSMFRGHGIIKIFTEKSPPRCRLRVAHRQLSSSARWDRRIVRIDDSRFQPG